MQFFRIVKMQDQMVYNNFFFMAISDDYQQVNGQQCNPWVNKQNINRLDVKTGKKVYTLISK